MEMSFQEEILCTFVDDQLLSAWRRVYSVGNLYQIKSANIERCEMLYCFICFSLEKLQRKKTQFALNVHGSTLFCLCSSCSFVVKNFFKLLSLTPEPSGWIDVLSSKVEPVLSARWRIHLFCCRRWREEVAWWSIWESNKQPWTDWGETALSMDGCQAGRLKFNSRSFSFFFDQQKKLKVAVRLGPSCLLSV